MKKRKGRLTAFALVVSIAVTLFPAGFFGVLAENFSLISNELTVQAARYPVRFYYTDGNGQQVLYAEEGFANPQQVEKGGLAQLPSGQPDTYPGYRFVGWDDRVAQPVQGATDIYALYEPLSTVTYTVEFVREDGAFVGESFYAVVREGELLQHTIPVPVLPGYYAMEDAAAEGFTFTPEGGGGSVSLDIPGALADTTYRVRYVSNPNTDYYVDHYVRTRPDTYTLHATQKLSGPTDSLARVQEMDIEGYALETDIGGISERIGADGQTRIRLDYAPREYSVYYDIGIQGKFGGTQENPVLVAYGESISMASTPTRPGYTFKQWTVEGNATRMPARDIVVTATWEPAQAEYLVVIWGENADKDPATGQYGYSVSLNYKMTGNTDSIATYNPTGTNYPHFTYSHHEQDVRIKGDGTSVLNVYYKRNEYTLIFEKEGIEFFRVKAKYQEDIRDRYNVPEFQAYRNANWRDSKNVLNATPSRMIGGNDRYREYLTSTGTRYTVYYYQQPLQANGLPNPNRSDYTLYGTQTFKINQQLGSLLVDRYALQGYELILPPGKTWSTNNTATLDRGYVSAGVCENTLYYNLLQYPLTFHDRGRSETVNVYYTADLLSHDRVPVEDGSIPAYEDFIFDGWYETQNFSGSPFVFYGRTMPSYPVVLYAKWVPPTYTVTFETGAGSAVQQQTVDKGGYAAEPSAPTLEGRVFEGWYRDAGYRSRFLFSQAIDQDMTLYAKWSGSNIIQVTIKHQDDKGARLIEDTYSSGLLGQTVTVRPEMIDGYLPLLREEEVFINSPHGVTVIFEYTPRKEVIYTVYYKDASDHTRDLRPPKEVRVPTQVGSTVVTEARAIIPGYTADAVQKTLYLVYPLPNDITFYYSRNSTSTSYAVVTHLERADGAGFDAQEPVVIGADLGAYVQTQPAPLEGYTFDPQLSNVDGTVLSGGALRLNLYYRRLLHTYEVRHINAKTDEAFQVDVYPNTRHGQQVTAHALEDDGLLYLFAMIGTRSEDSQVVTATIEDDQTAIEFFYSLQYTITAEAVHGTITPGTTKVIEGTDITFTFEPEEGYEFEALLVDGVEVKDPDKTQYTFTAVSAPHTISVRFVKKQVDLTITAKPQGYIYSGEPQGVVGPELDENLEEIITIEGLQQEHSVQWVTMDGEQETGAAVYRDVLRPTAVRVVDAAKADVTSEYTVTYNPGTLTIHPKGNGKPDGKGGELPLEITAVNQTFVYNGKPQGEMGAGLTPTAQSPLVTVAELVGGHTLSEITLTGTKRTEVGTYDASLIPSAARILDADRQDVTSNYLIDGSTYRAGAIKITPLGEDVPIIIRASDQHYVYNGALQGTFGEVTIEEGDSEPLATSEGLLYGHRLARVTLGGIRQKEPDRYENALTPSNAVIVDAAGRVVTSQYVFGPDSYVTGDLIIHKKGNGDDDGEGGEEPLDVTAADQHFVYNGALQGTFGTDMDMQTHGELVTARGLLPGHVLTHVSLEGTQRTLPETYEDAVLPTGVRIINTNDNNADVTDKYLLAEEGYIAGDLIIHKKGNGKDDGEGGEQPLEVRALDQYFIYNAAPQGDIGDDLPVSADRPLVEVTELVTGHSVKHVTIKGRQETNAGTYEDTLQPDAIKIIDGYGEDVTPYYNITSGSYMAGDLIIHKKGNGEDDGEEGELPLDIYAASQHFVYNAQPQGSYGDHLPVAQDAPIATATGLLSTHRLLWITLKGEQQILPDTYKDAIAPSAVQIVDGAGENVTENYLITPESYVNGDLIIHKKGNGEDDGEGGEHPLEITAADQHYVYNGQPHGAVGDDLPVDQADPLATAKALVSGHIIQTVSLKGDPQTKAGKYEDALLPTGIVIVEEKTGNDVTEYYNITEESYFTGDLIIHKKGNGEDDGEGGEQPLEITAADQVYVYNGQPQGLAGDDLPVDQDDPLATAKALVKGHIIQTVSLKSDPQTDAGTYEDALLPTGVVIVEEASGSVVTENYNITGDSYFAGDLIIQKKGNGDDDGEGGEHPMDVTAEDQHFIYNGEEQGIFGTGLAVEEEEPLATAVGLVPEHRLAAISITGTARTEASTYADELVPSQAVIVDAWGVEVTKNYLLTDESYHPGDLIIHKKGNGGDDGEGGELPLDITATEQSFIYNGAPQGTFGDNLTNPEEKPLAEAAGLVETHRIRTVSLSGAQQTDAGVYGDAILPDEAGIVDGQGRDVTENYNITTDSYHAGTLRIHPKGNGQPDGKGGELPMVITAGNQLYDYDGSPQGVFGENLAVSAQRPLASAAEPVTGHRLASITLSGSQETAPAVYEGVIVPTEAIMKDASGTDVTKNYLITPESYRPGTLEIRQGEGAVVIRAVDQTYEYDGTEKGVVGDLTLDEDDTEPLVVAEGLVFGHRLASVTLEGEPKTEPGDYVDTLIPSDAVILDGEGNNVTAHYALDADSYKAGSLYITPRNAGDTLRITAADQHYVYSGEAQGTFSEAAAMTDEDPLATAVGLLPGHHLASVALRGTQRTEPGTYTGAIRPADAKIVDDDQNDVTAKYLLPDRCYVAGSLIIHKKGNGEDDGEGGEHPLDVMAENQHFVYNGASQGTFGSRQAVQTEEGPLASAVGLLPGHTLTTISLLGRQRVLPDTYENAINPIQARITDEDGKDVTDKYLLADTGYHPGDLIIHKKGNGKPDGNGGEEPMEITATDQHYVYNEKPQGRVGENLYNRADAPLATAVSLVPGHTLQRVWLRGDPQVEPDTYPDTLMPYQVRIVDGAGDNVTENYLIDDTSFYAGDLVIHKKGNGTPDGSGGEEPLDVFAALQRYIYNGKAQGKIGSGLTVDEKAPLATAIGLLPGHRIAHVALTGEPQTNAGYYPETFQPDAVEIVSAKGVVVTEKYRIEDSGYHPGDLRILPKGNGQDDGNGGELPMEITAASQHYVYSGKPQGRFGAVTIEPEDALASAVALVPGHRLQSVRLVGPQQINPDRYEKNILPQDAVIVDADGGVVTSNYLITEGSYLRGDLIIHKKGNGEDDGQGGEKPMDVTAADQRFTYNGQPQGTFGAGLAVTEASPLASAVGLIEEHKLTNISLLGNGKTEPGEYKDVIHPLQARIFNESGQDVTAHYLLESSSYHPGKLTIYPKGNGEEEEDGREKPLDITAADQSFVYNGKAQGTFGKNLAVDPAKPLATAIALVPGHRIKSITLTGQQQMIPDLYENALLPSQVQIVDAASQNVTHCYRIEATSYHAGDLTIYPKGNGQEDEDGGEQPLEVIAQTQRFVYDGQPHGTFGDNLPVDARAPLAKAIALVPGHSILTVSLEGQQQTDPDSYRNAITPKDIVIVDANKQVVTAYYRIEPQSYQKGDLIIEEGDEPLTAVITAADQHYVYNEAYQGTTGTVILKPGDEKPLATAEGLLYGHRLQQVFIDGRQQRDPGDYTDTLKPSNAVIVDASGREVTHLYRLSDENYQPGTLYIHKKGNGEDDGNGGELPMEVTAQNQTYVYNGKGQGYYDTDIPVTKDAPWAAARGLLPGHRLEVVTLSGQQQTAVGTYADSITPSLARIVDSAGGDVTDKYLLTDESYFAGALIIHPKGNGEDDGNGGEKPMVIRAANQSFIYNGKPQGTVGANLPVDPEAPLAVATQLAEGHRLLRIGILGNRQTDADTYVDALMPLQAVIVDADGQEVTENYLITEGSYIAGDLTIHPKGNGEDDDNGGEKPAIIRAADQHYIYNEKPQGTFGTGLAVGGEQPLAVATELVAGHTLVRISLDGAQQTEPDTYENAITPSGAMIVDATGGDVTKNYLITPESYVKGNLIVHKKGNGEDDGNGGEKPLEVRAADQRYVYTGKPLGTFGGGLTVDPQSPLASAIGLLEDHRLLTVSLDGEPQTDAGTYDGGIEPYAVVIVNQAGQTVTDKYLIEPESFVAGDLIITPKGNGEDDGNGGENPLEITAADQHFIYNGKEQGTFGGGLPNVQENGSVLATAKALVEGHSIRAVSLDGTPRGEAGTYRDAVMPTGIEIVDAQGAVVTGNYNITDKSYRPGDLIIHKKGNGKPDGNGGELPMEVTAQPQRYIYNGGAQGIFGAGLENDPAAPWATAEALVPDHSLNKVTLVGMPQVTPATYQNAILPLQARIVDADGVDVTHNYLLGDSSYKPADLIIAPKGGGEDGEDPITVLAADQVYIYNGELQGTFGSGLPQDAADPLAVSPDLVAGHRVGVITLKGAQQMNAGIYTDTIAPSAARIVDAAGKDVTECYRLAPESYQNGTLIIHPKGNGQDDGNGGELPLEIHAADQRYRYTGEPLGLMGTALRVDEDSPIATAVELVPGHRLSVVTIGGEQQTELDTYEDMLVPSAARIVDEGGQDVTDNYLIVDESYYPGSLIILDGDAPLNIRITARDQHYIYSGEEQGIVGPVRIEQGERRPLAAAEGLLFGHRLVSVTIEGDRQTEPGEYTATLVPANARIVDANGNEMMTAYTLTDASYVPGTLYIHKKGNGNPDDEGGEEPLDITAADQQFVYNGQPQGRFGGPLAVSEDDPIASAAGLLKGHTLHTVTLSGEQQTNAASYPDAVVPSQVMILDENETDVTEKYRIEPEGYHAGMLTIHPKGNGEPDGQGGENPVEITAENQSYVYNGKPQGVFGEGLTPEGEQRLATIRQLVPTHRLQVISLLGDPQTDPGTYANAIMPVRARIADGAGNDVTANYRIEPESYRAGTLTIHKKGNGIPDGEGGEQPVEVHTLDQHFIYNGQPQGNVGADLEHTAETPLADIVELVPGHTLRRVSIAGEQRTDAGEYPASLRATGVHIVDVEGKDVTDKYRLESTSYRPGALVIHPKGNGQPDGNGGEMPLEIRAAHQSFTYNGQPQGHMGRNLAVEGQNPLATATELVPGQRLSVITISGKQEILSGHYPGRLAPSGARIVSSTGADVTKNYNIAQSSYRAGDLSITGNGAVYILSVHHIAENRDTLHIPSMRAHWAGDRCSYGPVVIPGYQASYAVILHNNEVRVERAPASAADLIMPDTDVSVVIVYTAEKDTPTPAPTTPTPTPTTPPGTETTPPPKGSTTPPSPPPGSTTPPARTPGPGSGGRTPKPAITPGRTGQTGTGTGSTRPPATGAETTVQDTTRSTETTKNYGDSIE